MDKLTQTANLFSQIEGISVKIIKSSLQIMISLLDDEESVKSNIVLSISSTLRRKGVEEKYTSKDILEFSREKVMSLITDSEKIMKEIKNFFIEHSDGNFQINSEGCPFLSEVWNGDSYDQTGVDGLKMLLKDLNGQLANVNEEYIIQSVVNDIYKPAQINSTS